MVMLRVPALAGATVALALAPAATAQTPGETLFVNNCAACHQPTGLGIKGAFPALAADKFVTGPPEVLTATVLTGRGGMPAFKADLSDEDMAATLTYIRAAWGNKAKPITTADVAAVRAKVAAGLPPKGLQAH